MGNTSVMMKTKVSRQLKISFALVLLLMSVLLYRFFTGVNTDGLLFNSVLDDFLVSAIAFFLAYLSYSSVKTYQSSFDRFVNFFKVIAFIIISIWLLIRGILNVFYT
jgi:hypothetical protein